MTRRAPSCAWPATCSLGGLLLPHSSACLCHRWGHRGGQGASLGMPPSPWRRPAQPPNAAGREGIFFQLRTGSRSLPMRPRVRPAHSLAHSFSEPEQRSGARGRPAPEDLWSPSQRGSPSSSCFTPALSLRLQGCGRQVPHGPWAPAAVSTRDTNPGPCWKGLVGPRRKGLVGPRLPDSPLLHTSQGCGLGTRRLQSTPSWH